ncbi:hypothetical protein MC7420_8176 [Coleofasciculus chthonoplastes PCC 7420]|uniref:Uncharacterized protein n=1 Tax=Coleofasciculus chthonoplastes PCC 7420 TaxID=118168 RepID=B4W4E9_9CYAN|nr:hypothetical protein MC7420_8176 [Coleofasciculus chthonoplastes PCC 7420]
MEGWRSSYTPATKPRNKSQASLGIVFPSLHVDITEGKRG